jgi:hypothetical protein
MSLLGSAKKKKKGEEAAETKPAKPAKAPKPAKTPAPTRGVVVEKPRANIYTALLALSLVAIIVGCICLYAELNAYEFKMR